MLGYLLSFFFLFVPVALEGIGFTFDRFYFLWFYILIPVLLYLISLLGGARFRFPPRLAGISLLFLICSGISSFYYSFDKQSSVELFLYSASLSLVFLYSYNNKITVRRFLIPVVIGLGIFFLIFSLGLPIAQKAGLLPFRVLHEKQVVFPYYNGHNHLGDFLGLILIFLFGIRSLKQKKVLFCIVLAAVFCILLLAGSRSAYAALFATLLLALVGKYHILRRRYLVAGTAVFVFLLLFFFIASSQDLPKTSFLYPLKNTAVQNLHMKPRSLWAGRDTYFEQSYRSIIAHPFFGIGGGNFIQASLRYNTAVNTTDSAHNIFMEAAVEQGLPASLLLFAILAYVFVAALRKKSVMGYALIFLLVNFQTDYTYQIYFFPVIVSLLAGLVYEEKKARELPIWIYGATSLGLFAACFFILTSAILTNLNHPAEAIRWYPFNKWAYIQAIQKETNRTKLEPLIMNARSVAPYDTGIMLASADTYLTTGDKRKAYAVYEAMYEANHSVAFSVIEKLFYLKRELISPDEALRFLAEVAGHYKYIYASSDFKREFADFCMKNRGEVCSETDWYWQ